MTSLRDFKYLIHYQGNVFSNVPRVSRIESINAHTHRQRPATLCSLYGKTYSSVVHHCFSISQVSVPLSESTLSIKSSHKCTCSRVQRRLMRAEAGPIDEPRLLVWIIITSFISATVITNVWMSGLHQKPNSYGLNVIDIAIVEGCKF